MSHRLSLGRRLKVTGSGRMLIALALAAGFAAINTGNNLLFLTWGVVLCAMVVSGILSEATLRPLSVSLLAPAEIRAKSAHDVHFVCRHLGKQLPAFAVEVTASVACPGHGVLSLVPRLVLRLPAGTQQIMALSFVPPLRGIYPIEALSVKTAHPFGFFVKERLLKPEGAHVVALPAHVEVGPLVAQILGRTGSVPTFAKGFGDELLELREFRQGDDARHVALRASIKANRLIVVDKEAVKGHRLTLVMQLDPAADAHAHDFATSVCASVAEALWHRGLAVGLRTHESLVTPIFSSYPSLAQKVLLRALATAEAARPMARGPKGHSEMAIEVGLVGPGTMRCDDVQQNLHYVGPNS